MKKIPQYRFARLPVPDSVLFSTESGTWKTSRIQQNRAFAPSTTRRNCFLYLPYSVGVA
jgi:hypothetical protein